MPKHKRGPHTLEQVRAMKSKTDWERVEAMTDEEIERNAASDPDNPVMTDRDWAACPRVSLEELLRRRPRKRSVTIRLDDEVVEWFKEKSPQGYQTAINAVLKAYKESRDRS
jgi:uncharacterized protein (DUF4415 family)